MSDNIYKKAKALIRRKKKNAKRRGIHFDLPVLSVVNMLKAKKCFYSTLELTDSNFSIDRIDVNKGYEKGNVVACHEEVNNMKNKREHCQDFCLKDFKKNCLKYLKEYERKRDNLNLCEDFFNGNLRAYRSFLKTIEEKNNIKEFTTSEMLSLLTAFEKTNNFTNQDLKIEKNEIIFRNKKRNKGCGKANSPSSKTNQSV